MNSYWIRFGEDSIGSKLVFSTSMALLRNSKARLRSS